MQDGKERVLFIHPPSPIPVIDHLPGHAAVDADVFAGDEARLVRAEEQHHMGDVHGIPHPTGRLLHGIRPFVYPVRRVDPFGRNRFLRSFKAKYIRSIPRCTPCECSHMHIFLFVYLHFSMPYQD